MSHRRAVFLDRDGVLNKNIFDPETGKYGAPLRPADLELSPGVIPALRALLESNFELFLVSNQPNHAKGKNSLRELAEIHDRLMMELQEAQINFRDVYYCYHHPEGIVAGYSGECECRKPSPYFLLKARNDYGIALEQSWMIGDRAVDVECGRAAGVRTIRVREDHPAKRAENEAEADFEAADLVEAVRIVREHSS